MAWGMGNTMTMYFTLFEICSVFAATLIVNFLILNGKTNYLEGVLLFATYLIIGLASFLYPQESNQSPLG